VFRNGWQYLILLSYWSLWSLLCIGLNRLEFMLHQ